MSADLAVLPPDPDAEFIASATSVEAAENCLRIWFFDKIEKVPRESSESQELGTRVHKVIEDHLRSGRTIPLPMNERAGQIAMAGAHLWPEDLTHVEIEKKIRFRIDDVDFVGYIDLFEHVEHFATVIDHKTTSNFKWVKTRLELVSNVQATLYVWFVAHAGWGVPDLGWLYYRTKGAPKALAVRIPDFEIDPPHLPITLDEIRPRVEKTLATARLLRKLKALPPGAITALDLPPTVTFCDRFNGCPHRRIRCTDLSPGQRIRSLMSNSNASAERTNTTGSMIEELKKRQAAKGANGVNPPATNHAPPTGSRGRPPADQECPEGMFWIWHPTGKQWTVAPEEFREKYDPDGSLAWVEPEPAPVAAKAAPPAFVPPAAPKVVEPESPPFDISDGEAREAERKAAETPKKGPGRPKGSTNAPKADAEPAAKGDPYSHAHGAILQAIGDAASRSNVSASELRDLAEALARLA